MRLLAGFPAPLSEICCLSVALAVAIAIGPGAALLVMLMPVRYLPHHFFAVCCNATNPSPISCSVGAVFHRQSNHSLAQNPRCLRCTVVLVCEICHLAHTVDGDNLNFFIIHSEYICFLHSTQDTAHRLYGETKIVPYIRSGHG